MKIKFIVTIFLSCIIFASFGCFNEQKIKTETNNVYSSNDEYKLDSSFDIVSAKLELMSKYKDMKKNISISEDIEREQEIYSIMSSDSLNQIEKKEKLGEMNVVYLDVPYSKLSSDSSDVTITPVVIYYDYTTGSWYLVGSGYWNSDEYCIDADGSGTCDNSGNYAGLYGLFAQEGDIDNIGGRDSVGIYLQDTSTPPANLALVSGYGKFYNYDETESIASYNYTRDINPSSLGAVYTFQDYLKVTEASYFLWALKSIDETYVAKKFTSVLRYNYDFANYSGNAVCIYAHSWDNTGINSIGLGLYSISISWISVGDGWSAQSSSDTHFD
ncbi:MAG: hypothetical protein JEZ05_10060 [Tenericutes bacterium]|nr:hypothetical protein [Mycoplasmatota bacterium]